MRISSRIKSLERAAMGRRGSCAVCNGVGKPVFNNYLGRGVTKGSPCPACGRVLSVTFVDMIPERRSQR